jgi:CubicO group peptidase (beta-lactamase class C family)
MDVALSSVDEFARATDFSGVAYVDRGDDVALAGAYGLADRAHGIANTLDTRFAIASGTKGLTALTVMTLVEDGTLSLATTARSVLGTDLPLIRDDVTVENLLGHRSGIGDYLDEEVHHELAEYLLPVPVHELVTTEDYLSVLRGHDTKFAPDERFSYCNSGYVVLALIAERAGGAPFHELVRERVSKPVGMRDTEFLRSDELPGNAAIGYLETDGLKTNVFHLPVRGSGDGGIYSTASDLRAFWRALFAGDIVPTPRVEEMTRPRSDVPDGSRRYGLGFWLDAESSVVMLEGYDAGVSFQSAHDPQSRATYTVISNTTDGAWPLARALDEWLRGGRSR